MARIEPRLGDHSCAPLGSLGASHPAAGPRRRRPSPTMALMSLMDLHDGNRCGLRRRRKSLGMVEDLKPLSAKLAEECKLGIQ